MTPEIAFWHACTNTPIPETHGELVAVDPVPFPVFRHPGAYHVVEDAVTGARYRHEPELPLPPLFSVVVPVSEILPPHYWSLPRLNHVQSPGRHRPASTTREPESGVN